MKKPITKAHIRTEMEQQIDDYLSRGGSVVSIEQGISGHDTKLGPLKNEPNAFDQPKANRTYVSDVIAAIDARRSPAPKPKPRKTKPYKKIFYDDFGEPLRWQWVEE